MKVYIICSANEKLAWDDCFTVEKVGYISKDCAYRKCKKLKSIYLVDFWVEEITIKVSEV